MRQNWLSFARRPLDAGRSYHGKRIFGDSKTWRGVLVAAFGCILGVAIQKHIIGSRAANIARLDYAHVSVVVLGLVMGVTAMLGELPNSFVKRRINIPPGQTTEGWRAAIFYIWEIAFVAAHGGSPIARPASHLHHRSVVLAPQGPSPC
jgi:hypothetical protein